LLLRSSSCSPARPQNIFRSPHYGDDIALQMDIIGVGSLPIAVLTGFFSGAVMALQMSRALSHYGQVGKTGTLVSLTLVRELGPVLTALMVAGRNSSGMASELGSMKVTEQIDAMRALGTDPIQKLVTPRLIATCTMLPLLTIIADFVGIFGGWVIAFLFLHIESRQYWSTAWRALEWNDVAQGLLKPFVFAFAIALIGCFYGLRTTGGTQGVGRATTQAMVTASVLIFILDVDHRQDLRQPGGELMPEDNRQPVLRFDRVTVTFGDRGAVRRLFRGVRRRIARDPGRGRQRQDGAAQDRLGTGEARFRRGLRIRREPDRHAASASCSIFEAKSACCSRKARSSIP
jgi:phospholipid/cholesterol/gamma-HCH transport system permease protein